MNFTVRQDPYRSLAASVVTSETIDLRDAFDFTLSVHTVSATTTTASEVTYQVSNWTGKLFIDGDPPEATWSTWTNFTAPSGGSMLAPILGVRYSRILRTPSAQSMQFFENKHVR